VSGPGNPPARSSPGRDGAPGRLARLWRHLWTDRARLRRLVDASALDAIEQAVRDGERTHRGELRVVFEASLPLQAVLAGVPARERALEVFGLSRVWDTEDDSGVLLYVLLADRAVEIVADRGAARAIAPDRWVEVANELARALAAGDARGGTCAAVSRIHALLHQAFPIADRANPDELPDRPSLL
jgi:uncharacterized membrane protein